MVQTEIIVAIQRILIPTLEIELLEQTSLKASFGMIMHLKSKRPLLPMIYSTLSTYHKMTSFPNTLVLMKMKMMAVTAQSAPLSNMTSTQVTAIIIILMIST